MAKKKKKKRNRVSGKPKTPVNRNPVDPESMIPEDDLPDISDEEMVKAISDLQQQNPEMMKNIFGELNNWRNEFIKEHGHEPSEEDLMAIFDDDDWDEFDDYDDELEEDIPAICNTCAWCLRQLEAGEERFTFGVKTRIDITPFEDPTQPMVMTLSDNKTIQAIITTPDSPARKDGYQLLIMCCSKACIEQAQEALQTAIDIDSLTLLN